MPTIKHNNTTYEVCEDGFLKNKHAWDDSWIDYVRTIEDITEITDAHQKVIYALHEYHRKNGISPMTRIMSKITDTPLIKIYELFPSGPGKGACKMAGIPKPSG